MPTRSVETGKSGVEPGTLERTIARPCRGECGRDVELRQVYVLGTWLPPNAPLCDACAEALEEQFAERQRENQEQARQQERARREARILELLEKVGGSPWEHGRSTFENFDTSESGPSPLDAARRFVERVKIAGRYDPVPGVYFAGPTGAGKSHLAHAIARELLLTPEIDPSSVVFDPADVLVSRIRSLYGGRGDVDAFLRRREDAKVWILDDLGREPPHPDVVGHLTMLIAQRAKRGTVITGNLMPEEYEDRHPDLARIGSRLGPAYFRVERVEGSDRRWST